MSLSGRPPETYQVKKPEIPSKIPNDRIHSHYCRIVLVPMSYGTQYCRSDSPETSSKLERRPQLARAGPKCAITYAMIGIEMQKGYFWGARDHADEIDALYCMQKHLLQPNLALGIFRYHLVFLKPKRAENTKWDFSGALASLFLFLFTVFIVHRYLF